MPYTVLACCLFSLGISVLTLALLPLWGLALLFFVMARQRLRPDWPIAGSIRRAWGAPRWPANMGGFVGAAVTQAGGRHPRFPVDRRMLEGARVYPLEAYRVAFTPAPSACDRGGSASACARTRGRTSTISSTGGARDSRA